MFQLLLIITKNEEAWTRHHSKASRMNKYEMNIMLKQQKIWLNHIGHHVGEQRPRSSEEPDRLLQRLQL